ncbi:MAG: alcohol dehydrogenase catalytic domain-containing protein [Planctomycetota bacterium]|nr:alcohol dehydrogenase catalytic domain-containing protein [Planctomycetota bacterium]
MRALIFDGTNTRLEVNRPEPAPAPGEAVIRTTRAAVGGIDLEISQGLGGFSGTLGREFVGVVEAIEGEDSIGLTGKRVVGSINVFCGACDMCQAGLSRHCRNRTLLGMDGRDGCLADRFTLPTQNLLAVPDSVDDDHAVFAQSLGAAMQAVRQLTIEGKPYITVLGDGPLGLLMVQVMAKLNASVRLVGRYSEKLMICEKWGIRHRHVDDVGRRADQDIVVDCTGSPTGLELAMRLVRPRGKVLLKSLLAPTSRMAAASDLTPLVLNEIELIGSSTGPVEEAVSALARGEVDVLSLISRRMSLDDGAELLHAAARPGMLKVLVNI